MVRRLVEIRFSRLTLVQGPVATIGTGSSRRKTLTAPLNCSPQLAKSAGKQHLNPDLRAITYSVLSLIGAAHRYPRKDPAAEIRAGER